MSDNVIDLFTKKSAVKTDPEIKLEVGNTLSKIDSFPGIISGCAIEMGTMYSIGLTNDSRVVVLYGSDARIPEHLHHQVMENRPAQGWEMAILTTFFGMLQSQEAQKKEQASEVAREVVSELDTEELKGWYQNVQWSITRRVTLDQAKWPAHFRHGKVVFESKGTSAISAHGDSFVLVETDGRNGYRAVSYSLSKNVDDKPILQLTFVRAGSVGGGSSTWTSFSKVYPGWPYTGLGDHTPEHSASIAGTTWNDGYEEMMDISAFLATGIVPGEKTT